MLPIVIVYPVIAAGSEVESVAVSVDSSLEQDEKDIARITKKSRERERFTYCFSLQYVEEVRLNIKKFKLFNPIVISTKTKKVIFLTVSKTI